jgi:hypothetical protein
MRFDFEKDYERILSNASIFRFTAYLTQVVSKYYFVIGYKISYIQDIYLFI